MKNLLSKEWMMAEKKKKLSKKDKNRVLESLMGFYQAVLSIFGEGCNRFEEEKLSALIIKAHIFEIIDFHAKRAVETKLPIPKTTEVYKEYIDIWNKHILSKDSNMKKIIADYYKKKDVSYIS